MKQGHPQTGRKKKTSKHQSSKHQKSQKKEQANFVDGYCKVPEESDDAAEQKKESLSYPAGNQNRTTEKPSEGEEKQDHSDTLHSGAWGWCGWGGGGPQRQTQHGDEEEPGSKNARRTLPEKRLTHEPKTQQAEQRNNAPEQEQIRNKQAHPETNTTRQMTERTMNEDKNMADDSEATTEAAAYATKRT